MLNYGVLNHYSSPIKFSGGCKYIKAPFQFFNLWCDHLDFLNIVQKIWRTLKKGGNMFRIYQKLKLLRIKLTLLNRRSFRMILDNVLQCKSSLDDRQSLLQSDHFNFDLEKREMSQCIQLQQLSTWEEKFLK